MTTNSSFCLTTGSEKMLVHRTAVEEVNGVTLDCYDMLFQVLDMVKCLLQAPPSDRQYAVKYILTHILLTHFGDAIL